MVDGIRVSSKTECDRLVELFKKKMVPDMKEPGFKTNVMDLELKFIQMDQSIRALGASTKGMVKVNSFVQLGPLLVSGSRTNPSTRREKLN